MRLWWGGLIFYLIVAVLVVLTWQSRPLFLALPVATVEPLTMYDNRTADLIRGRRFDDLPARLIGNHARDHLAAAVSTSERKAGYPPSLSASLAAHRAVDRMFAAELARLDPHLTAGQEELLNALEGQYRQRAALVGALASRPGPDVGEQLLHQAIHMQMLIQRLSQSDLHGA